MDLKKITVVIPTYCAEKTIERCVVSVVSSDYPKDLLEVLVIDNNTPDRSAEIASRVEGVKVIREPQQGRSFARNRGIREANGELVAFIDADVYLHPSWLKEMASWFQKPWIGGGQGRTVPCQKLGLKSLNEYRIKSIGLDTSGTFSLPHIINYEMPMINSAACMYRKGALLDVGGFDLSLERHEDIDLSKRVFYTGYDLFSTQKAEAYVVFHGEGWCDYFKRSFADGYWKNLYLFKWHKISTDVTPMVDVKNSVLESGAEVEVASAKYAQRDRVEKIISLESHEMGVEVPQEKAGKVNLKEAIKYLLHLVGMTIKHRELFWLVKTSLFVVNCFGRLVGKRKLSDKYEETILYRKKDFTKTKSGSGKLKLNTGKGFVYFDDYCNVIDYKTTRVVRIVGFIYLYFSELFSSDSSQKSVDEFLMKKLQEEEVLEVPLQ